MNPIIEAGQFWQVQGYLYVVTSTQGSDACYPICMSEVARDPAINPEIDRTLLSMPAALRRHAPDMKAPCTMAQEHEWFVRRAADVKRWRGTPAQWLAQYELQAAQ